MCIAALTRSSQPLNSDENAYKNNFCEITVADLRQFYAHSNVTLVT